MNVAHAFICPLRKFFRSARCPVCRRILRDFGIDVEKARIRCGPCGREINPTEVFSDSEWVWLAQKIPAEQGEDFLRRLGFEKRSKARTPQLLVVCLIVVVVVGILMGIFINFVFKDSPFGALLTILVGGMIMWQVLRSYQEEKSPKWKRK
jgi:F0F1-type ATP synthase assembly protein I